MFPPFYHPLEVGRHPFDSLHHVLAGSTRFRIEGNNIDDDLIALAIIVHVQDGDAAVAGFQGADHLLLIGITHQFSNGLKILHRRFHGKVTPRSQDKSLSSCLVKAGKGLLPGIVGASHQ